MAITRHSRWSCSVYCVLILLLADNAFAQTAKSSALTTKPKVRAITAFIQLDISKYQQQLADTLKMLRGAKQEYERAGYEVESVRITTQPFPQYTKGMSDAAALEFFRNYDEFSRRESFDPNIGPAMVADNDDPHAAELLARVLSENKSLEASIIAAGPDGVHWKAVHAAARVIKYVEEHSPRSQGNFNFTVTAMLEPYGPFYPGSYHLGAGHQFSVGLESANVVDAVLAASPGDYATARQRLTEELTRHAQDCERVARQIEKTSGWTYTGLDPTPAPLGKVSIGAAIEKFTGARFGSSGTLTAAAMITSAVRAVAVKQVGYIGLMVPVLEDERLAERWSQGAYTIDALLAYSAVCGTGLDTVPLPGDVSEEQLAGILGDVASLAVRWKKPLSGRLQPVAGKKAGERTEFDDPFLSNAVLQPLP
ncbi:MAG TPA: DUF711 family protein [Terriglobales bacterium]|nr:DUF711 family protein [Terriglobales bacterium]